MAYWSLLQQTLNLNCWASTSCGRKAFLSRAKRLWSCTAMFHLSVVDCAPFWLIIVLLLWPENILTWIPCQADSIYGVNISACSHLIPSESEPACWVVTQITPVKVMTGALWHAWRVRYSPNSFTSKQHGLPCPALSLQTPLCPSYSASSAFFFFFPQVITLWIWPDESHCSLIDGLESEETDTWRLKPIHI